MQDRQQVEEVLEERKIVLNRPHHMLMLAPGDMVEGICRTIHMANAFCEAGTKVTLVCRPQLTDNAKQLKCLLHKNASVYIARANTDRQILHQLVVKRLAEEKDLPMAERYDLTAVFEESAKIEFERESSSLRSQLIKRMPFRIQRLIRQIFDEDAAFGRAYLGRILPPHLYQKYKDLLQLYHYNYFFLIQTLIIHKFVEPIDAIFAHELWTLPVGCATKELLGIPLLYDSHEIGTGIFMDSILQNIALFNEKWMYQLCDSFSTTSEGMANYYRELCPFLNVLVISNAHRKLWHRPADLSTLKERLSLPPGTPLAVYVGNLHPISHLDRFIEALAHCGEDLHLAIVGSGGDIERYRQIAETSNLENRVFFLGRVDFEEVFGTIYGADFGIIPNLQNYTNPANAVLSAKLFDYAQVEMPFISDHGAEIQKIVDQFRVGQTVNFQQPPVAIAKMLDDFYKRVMAGEFPENERKRARESFVWPTNVVDQILSC
jgi:Glycosyltransferase